MGLIGWFVGGGVCLLVVYGLWFFTWFVVF